MAITAEKGTPLKPQVVSEEIEVEAPAEPKKPNLAQAKAKVRELMQKEGINPQQLVMLGQMARKSISDPALFQMFKQQVVANGIADEKELAGKDGLRLLAIMATVGKMAEQMLASGELKG